MSDSEAMAAPKVGPTLEDVRAYLYWRVAIRNKLELAAVSDATVVGPAAFDIAGVLAARLNQVVYASTEMTIDDVLKQLKLK